MKAYQENICDCLKNENVIPQWYLAMDNDMKEQEVDTLYPVTDHTSFYEKYGWKFLCIVQGDGEPDMIRMHIHQL